MIFPYALIALAASVAYAQGPTASGWDDTQILNYALNLTDLQNAFYSQSLSKFDTQSFNSSGYGPFVRTGFVQIGQNKASQAALLGSILGANATASCTYNFSQVSNTADFTEGSQIVENIGESN
ncbi:putative ferritin-like domain containing protein [Lyophyllum shimeji]|uniref:Ferritin-like domain containing protein n=1 Tax=Lyophyllum shimeji TaxID=47721 RepID=A0A9P3Q126_LYOSH|nr:putative ferritin-like domain containing protein [Lyophyllum shimeji]